MRAALRVWASDHHGFDLPPAHPFPVGKYTAVREALLADGTLTAPEVHRSEPAPRDWLLAAHDADYVDRTLAAEWVPAAVRRLGLPLTAALVTRARAAVYGTVMASRAALTDGVAGNLAGGTHHAFPDRGEAYCLFNDAAVALVLLFGEGRIARPLVLDLDVHHGNGTAVCFAGDPRVFTLSVHARHNYPLEKPASSLDVALDDGTGDEAYLAALEAHVPAALDAHRPDFVIYQAGVDALHTDRLGRLRLTHAGLAERDRRVFAWLEARGIPVCVTLGGGYGRPLETTVAAHAQVFRAARAARVRRAAAAR
jgi:acetoin utilization deacetylase AcuC-like enzyme